MVAERTLMRGAFVLYAGLASTVIAAACGNSKSSAFGNGDGPGMLGGSNGGPGSLGDGGSGGVSKPCMPGTLQCQAEKDNCAGQGKPLTSITGTVYDPAGGLPLNNVYVYIPTTTPDPIQPGNPVCTQCQAPASGSNTNRASG